MDTRTKIVVAPPEDCDVAEGCFDPLLAAHAAQLQTMKSSRPLAVVIREPEAPLLDARARAELVAALAAVDFVVIGGDTRGIPLREDRETLMNTIRRKHGR